MYHNNAQVDTNSWESYQQVIPSNRHYPSTKKSGQTTTEKSRRGNNFAPVSYQIERFNNTLRQRCSRLVRKDLSFSKNFFDHEGAILYFVHHYNRELLLN
ncbi:MAG: hypothetical protein BRC47_04550 [Cyanobacteria bacterium QS_7_48_42]|nr:MAG: hypothetical protein BRC47_04550 [Cyanobacteria bacterium QS_7_48_42]